MIDSRQEEILIQCIEKSLVPFSFKRLDPVPQIDATEIVAAWKRKTLTMNRAVAVIRFGDSDTHPGDFAQRIKKPVGKAIGYLPFIYELGLQLILVGRECLHLASDLQKFVDTINTQTVILQSLHLVETASLGGMGDPEASGLDVAQTPEKPGWVKGMETALRFKNPFFRFEPGRIHAHYSSKTGHASMSVSTWGQGPTRPIIDAIESGISNYLEQS